MRNTQMWIATWFVLAALFAFMTGREGFRYFELSRDGDTVRGVVTGKGPHLHINYSFNIAGREYSGVGRGDIKDSSYYQAAIGDAITVHYLKGSPSINCLSDPARLFHNELLLVAVAVLVFPTMIVTALVYRNSREAVGRVPRLFLFL